MPSASLRIALLVFAIASIGCVRRTPVLAREEPCDVAVVALKLAAEDYLGEKPWVLIETFDSPRFVYPERSDPELPPTHRMVAPSTFDLLGEKPGTTPVQRSTLRALVETQPASAAACDAVRMKADAIKARLPPAILSNPRALHDGRYALTEVAMSKPALSDDRSEAIVYVSYLSGPLSASGHLLLLRRNEHGVWKRVGGENLWIS